MKLELNESLLIGRRIFFDLYNQLGGEIYRKDNYYVFCEMFSQSNLDRVKVEAEYEDNFIIFEITNRYIDRKYLVYFNKDTSSFVRVQIFYLKKDKIFKDLEMPQEQTQEEKDLFKKRILDRIDENIKCVEGLIIGGNL